MFGLVADIGSTNCRFALTPIESETPQLVHATTLKTADYSSLADATRAYLKGKPGDLEPRFATFAVAGPVAGETVRLTNHPWSFSIDELRRALNLSHVHVINDFAAVSLSLAALPSTSFRTIGPNGTKKPGCLGVLGPGTGLGVGALLTIGGKRVPVPSEGGHASFAPTSADQMKIAALLAERFGHVSNERVLSGPGLINLYRAICSLEGKSPDALTPADISERAIDKSDPLCVATLAHFCAILGAVAGDVALLFCADAIYIAGGIAPRIVDVLASGEFRRSFENKGRFQAHMKDIATHIITEPNPGLLGAVVDLRQNHQERTGKCP